MSLSITAIVVLVTFWMVDLRMEQHAHVHGLLSQLEEEAKVIRVTRGVLKNSAAFQDYVDRYCHQMERHVSPGHHILVLESDQVVARAHERDEPELEQAMVQAHRRGSERFSYEGQAYAVSSEEDGSHTFLVTQSLAPVERVIRRQAISRLAALTVLVGTILAVTTILLFWWVRRPIRSLVLGVQAISDRQFEHRIAQLSTSEFQLLSDGFNRMSESLGRYELNRILDMDKARRIQMRLLPHKSLKIPGLTLAAHYTPAEGVGGDFYDAIQRPDGKWIIVVADVSGHGIAAALITAMLRSIIRLSVSGHADLTAIVKLVNAELHSLVECDFFATCLLTLFDPQSGTLEYLSCGHEPALIIDDMGRVTGRLEGTGLPVGISSGGKWETQQVALPCRSRLFLVTDGFVEVFNGDGELFGRRRLTKLLCSTATQSPQEQIEVILKTITRFQGRGSFEDDLTLVVLERTE